MTVNAFHCPKRPSQPATLGRGLWLCLIWAAGFSLTLGSTSTLFAQYRGTTVSVSNDQAALRAFPHQDTPELRSAVESDVEEDEPTHELGRTTTEAPFVGAGARHGFAPRRHVVGRRPRFTRGIPVRGPPGRLL